MSHQIQDKPSDIYTLITGSSSGIGKALAMDCARRNMNVLLVALPGSSLKRLSEEIQLKFGVKSDFFFADLTSEGSEIELHEWLKQKRYRVNFLINNAGISCEGPLEKFTAEHYRKIILLNMNAVVLLTKELLPELESHSQSHVLNLGSAASFFPMPFKAVYGSSKIFILYFSRLLKTELGSGSLKISILCPGPSVTNRHTAQSYLDKGTIPKMMHTKAAKIASIGMSQALKGKFLILPGFLSKASFLLSWLLPQFILNSIVSSVFYND